MLVDNSYWGQGRRAALEGKDWLQNPYAELDTFGFVDWLAGWTAGKQESQKFQAGKPSEGAGANGI
jgi:hypothetical protein